MLALGEDSEDAANSGPRGRSRVIGTPRPMAASGHTVTVSHKMLHTPAAFSRYILLLQVRAFPQFAIKPHVLHPYLLLQAPSLPTSL